MKTILAAIDGSDHSRRAAELATDMAVKYDAKLLFLHVLDEKAPSEAEQRMAQTEYSEQFKRHAIKSDIMDLRAMGPRGVEPIFNHFAETSRTIRTAVGEGLLESATRNAKNEGLGDVNSLLENGDPATVIVDVAKKKKADIIVMGSRGQSDIKALFMGSVSHKVANTAEANVIAVK